MTQRRRLLVLIWLVLGILTALSAALSRDSSTIGDQIVPMGNDAFYHARRMIDTAGERGFYEFDEKTHAPEGSWVNWPWAYDYLAGKALQVALAINPAMQPMAFLAWLPVIWVFINLALFIGIASRLRLNTELIACAGLAFALSATVQLLHSFANVDHHFVELTFILASLYTLMRWLDRPTSRSEAVATGLVLALAPAFHTAAFVLQLPMLLTLFLLWMRGATPPAASVRAMISALLITTTLILLPSAAFRDGQFALYTLSWFHGYVAICTAVACVLMAAKPVSAKRFGLLAVVSVALVIPLVGSVMLSGQFLSGELPLFDLIEEVRSPIAGLFSPATRRDVFRLHSWLIVLTPVIMLLLFWQVIVFLRATGRNIQPHHVAFATAGLFGLALMCLQQRLLYFGIAPLYIGTILLLTAGPFTRLPRAGAGLAALAIVAISAQPQLRGQLFAPKITGLDRNYELTFPIYSAIRDACAAQPGLVIAHNNDGHMLRYHSACSVLVNNMIITRQHERKILQMSRLVQLSPEQFLREAPAETRYLFVLISDVYLFTPDGAIVRSLEEIRRINPRLFTELMLADRPPPGYQLIDEVRMSVAPNYPLARFYRVTPVTD